MKINMIITAAGLSSRQPPNKLLIPVDGKTVIEKTVESFTGISDSITVVVGFMKEHIIPVLTGRFGKSINIVENDKYREGLSTSLAAGINSYSVVPDYWGFCNGDKPFIKRSTVSDLTDILSKKQPGILAPIFENQNGHPVFFNSRHSEMLKNLTGDVGARGIITGNHADFRQMDTEDRGVIMDMDLYLNSDGK